MDHDSPKRELESLRVKKRAAFRLCNVSSYTSEILEIRADNPTLHALFIPGNPGVVPFYKDFVETLYELLGGTASVTAVGHISHTKKMDFIKQEMQNTAVPILLVGHSIGSYISIQVFKRSPERVAYCIGLYPFLALDPQSKNQALIGKLRVCFRSRFLCVALIVFVTLLGLLPKSLLRLIVTTFLGKSWSAAVVEAACSHLVKYHTMQNILLMAMTEFQKIGKQVPDAALSIEREGHTHGFCCTEAGSLWVSEHVAGLIKSKVSL